MEEKQYKIKEVSYRIDMSEDNTEAFVTPVIDMETEQNLTLLAYLELDGHELIPSARLQAVKGENRIEMKYFRIVRPPYFRESYSYKCDLHISHDCREYETFSETITLDGVE
jgi:hypothetical protein